MKMQVGWHEGCLKNKKVYLQKLNIRLLNLSLDIDHARSNIDILDMQIRRAKEEGKTDFDHERYQPFKGAKYDLK